jgi:hypothetical protein
MCKIKRKKYFWHGKNKISWNINNIDAFSRMVLFDKERYKKISTPPYIVLWISSKTEIFRDFFYNTL